MRTTQTIILRLYFDSEVPERLCGDVQVPPDRKTIYFQNETGLVDFLHRLAALKTGVDPDPRTAPQPDGAGAPCTSR
jgi:hypothetical protein